MDAEVKEVKRDSEVGKEGSAIKGGLRYRGEVEILGDKLVGSRRNTRVGGEM